MKVYLQIIKAAWQEYLVYRLSFVLWRVRVMMQILVTYFLWRAIFSQRQELFGYTQQTILTYILLTLLIRTFSLATRTLSVSDIINSGKLSNYLIRPINFFRYLLTNDLADKLLNSAFAIVEVSLLFLILQPPLFIQAHPMILLATGMAVLIGIFLFFYFSLILGFLGFWTPDAWAPRFLSFVLIEFFAGGLFPLDILPKPLFNLSQILPFFYFIYFPIKIYLGQLSSITLIRGLLVGSVWVVGLWWFAHLMWKRGLKRYGAEGR